MPSQIVWKESGWNRKDCASTATATTTNGQCCLPHMLHVPFNDNLDFGSRIISYATFTPGTTIKKVSIHIYPDAVNNSYCLLLAPTLTKRHPQCRTLATAYERVGRLQTNPIHCFNCTELIRTKESAWNRKDGASTHRLRLPQIVSTCSVDSMKNLYSPLFATLPRRRLQHPASATVGQTAKVSTNLRADRSTHGAFELTGDAPGFMKGGLRTMDSKYHGTKLIEKRVDGIKKLREIVSLYPTRRTCH